MPTTKTRINLSVPEDINKALHQLSKKENTPIATKALELLKQALELEEDIALEHIADQREKKSSKQLSHDEVWA